MMKFLEPMTGDDYSLLERLKRIFLLHLGILLVAVGAYFFKFPNNFTVGGVSGYAVILAKLTPYSPVQWTTGLNMLLLVAGWLYFGKKFAFVTAYASVLLSAVLSLFEHLMPLSHPLTNQPLLELLFAALLPAAGSAILFNLRATSGGTDILAMILKDKAHTDIGQALMLCDIVAAMIAAFVFDIKTALFSLTGLMVKGVLIDSIIESINLVKYFTIITDKPEEITRFITQQMHRSATLLLGKGIYSGREKCVLLCVVRRPQAVLLRDFVRTTDPSSFIMISNTSETIGRGFRSDP